MYKECKLFGIKRKKEIRYILDIENTDIMNLNNNYNVFIKDNSRLVETPIFKLKAIHKKIKKYFKQIKYPKWLLSQAGYSYVDNGKIHKDSRYVLTLDIKGFFPNSNRNFVYNFYRNKLKMSPDVSKIMCDITTIDLEKYNYSSGFRKEEIFKFIDSKKMISLNHIPTGSQISSYLAFLAYYDMFNEIYRLINNEMKFSVYVDDITISSNKKISKNLIYKVEDILKKYNHRISKNKIKLFNYNKNKKITGTILTPNNIIKIPNSLHEKIYDEFIIYEENNFSSISDKEAVRKRLYGRILSARQIDEKCYGYIYGRVKKCLIK